MNSCTLQMVLWLLRIICYRVAFIHRRRRSMFDVRLRVGWMDTGCVFPLVICVMQAQERRYLATMLLSNV